ncbi:hypothetical protein AB0M95_36330 [Sphaerisporangium sp. NPDC051017]|uniref:hypothetical protein n=1 Tax=unclassified Sphaerisporangium TaxID=2630420 RepID=UPI00340BEFDC
MSTLAPAQFLPPTWLGLGGPGGLVSRYFWAVLKLGAPGFDRVRVMDRVGLAAALFDGGEPEQGIEAALWALDEEARADSTRLASRLNTLSDATRSCPTAAVNKVRARVKNLVAARRKTVTA